MPVRPVVVTGGGDTKSDLQRGRVYKHSPQYRQTVRDVYRAQPAPRREALRRAAVTGRTVEAQEIRRAAARDALSAHDMKSASEFLRAQRYVAQSYGSHRLKANPDRHTPVYMTQGTTVPMDVAMRARFRQAALSPNSTAAPALKVLEQTTRPVHGVAAGVHAALHGDNVLRAAGRGLALKDKTLFSDVLRDIGAPKAVQAVGGFALDVALDPTTYLTGGTASIARQAAKKAAVDAERRALAQGLTVLQARRFGQRAARRAAQRVEDRRGVSVRVAGREVPGVTRATAAAGRAASRVAPGPLRKVAQALRHGAADVNPGIAPDGLPQATYQAVREATRTARSSTSRDVFKARERARAVQAAIGKDHYQRVLDAIEKGDIRSLPSELRTPARFLRDQFKYARRVEKRAGIRGATRKNYVPHLAHDLAEEGRGMGEASVGARTIRPSSSRARKDNRTLEEIRQAEPGKYIEDPGVLYAARLSESALSRGRAELNRRLGELGRRIQPGRAVDLRAGEAVFHIRGSDIRQLDPRKVEDRGELQRLVNGKGRNGQYVALNEQAVNRALKTVSPGIDRSTLGRAVDRVQGSWKFLATQPNPGFHLRNFVGDLQNAYLAESAPTLARNLVQSGGALRVLGKEERALRTLGHAVDPGRKGLTINGEKVSYGRLIAEAEKVGAIRSGFVGRELDDLMRAGKRAQPSREKTLSRWLKNREDVIRLATYIGGRKRGLTAEQATARVARFHFDYADLTELERKVFRRVMPFYTFSARNIPLQFKALLTSPGKYAQYEKVREELAKAFGYKDGWEADLPEREQRSVGLPVKIGGKPLTISLGPSGLPLTDLNEFPTTGNPIKQADEWLQRAMSLVTPGIKTPVELWANMSFFFRDQIERDEGPLVPAPSWVGRIPEKYRKDLGIVPDYVDRRSGKKQWGWPAKIGYAVGVLPGPAAFLNRVLTPSERAGQSPASKTLGYLGVRAVPVDAVSTKIENLYNDRAKVQKKMAAFNQRGITADNSSPAYDRLRAQDRDLTSHIMALRTTRGDKIQPGRKRKSGGFAWPDKGGGFKWPDR